MCTANLVDKANSPEADFGSLLFAARARAYDTALSRSKNRFLPPV